MTKKTGKDEKSERLSLHLSALIQDMWEDKRKLYFYSP
jgi:hypothetical protein